MEEKIKYTRSDLYKLTNEELTRLLIEYEVPFDPDKFQRKPVVEDLMLAMIKSGDTVEPTQLTDESSSGKISIPGKEYIDVIFHNQEGQPKYQFLGHNGVALYLPREHTCRIPAVFEHVMRDAVYRKIVQVSGPEGKIINKEVKVPRISYEIVGRGTV